MRYIAKFSQLKGDEEQCLVDLPDNLALPRRKRTGKAGRLPGWHGKDKVLAAHLVTDVGLVALAAPSVIDTGLVAHEVTLALAMAQVSTGAHPRNFWRCALRPQK